MAVHEACSNISRKHTSVFLPLDYEELNPNFMQSLITATTTTLTTREVTSPLTSCHLHVWVPFMEVAACLPTTLQNLVMETDADDCLDGEFMPLSTFCKFHSLETLKIVVRGITRLAILTASLAVYS